MNPENFIGAIREILSAALKGLISHIESPPGRRPSQKLLRVSEFYQKLSEQDKLVFNDALELSARQCTNNLLSILDGSLAIEPYKELGELELYYNDGSNRTRLNDPEQTPLNEIFRSFSLK